LFYITRNLYEALCQRRQPKVGFADVDRRSEPFNKTGLIKAAEKGSLKRVIEYLEQGADHTCQDNFGETALHYAAENVFSEIVRFLLSKGADMNTLDRSGRNPLSCCLQLERHQWQETAEILQNWNSRNSSPAEDTPDMEVPLWIDAVCINQDDISERNSPGL
jgi:ankyrin repeat protein